MAIVVGHGGGFGDAGKIIAQALGQERQIGAQKAAQVRELQNRGAIASARAQMQYEASREANKAAMARAAIGAGLQKDMQRQEYLQGLEEARVQAKDTAAKFDQKFTSEQRIKDAKLQQARSAIEGNENLSPEEKEEALMRLDVAIASNSTPTQVLGNAQAQAPEEGKELGKVWAGAEDGSWKQGYYTTNPEDGSAKLLVRPDQTPEFHAEKAQREAEVKRDEREQEAESAAREDKLNRAAKLGELVAKYASTAIEVGSGDESVKRVPNEGEVQSFERSMARHLTPVEPDTYVSTLQQEVGDLLEPYRKQYGSYEAIPDELRSRAVEAVRQRYGYYDRGGGGQQQGSPAESQQWLDQAQQQYGSFAAMPEDVKAQAVRHKQIAGSR